MITKTVDSIAIDDLQALIDNGVREGRTIEYKRELPSSSDADKKEFLADVSSFANAGGGDLIYGMDAKDGLPIAALGIASLDQDKESLRLESLLRDGIEPRMPGVQLRMVPGGSLGALVFVRVPKSWSAPHMITFKGSSRFFSRGAAGKFPMDVTEIRSAFAASGDLSERIRRWRDERLGRVVADETPFKLSAKDRLVLHLVPFDSFADEWRFHATAFEERRADFPPLHCEGWDSRLNLDGYLAFSRPGAEVLEGWSYTQVFRSGRIEAAMTDVLLRNGDQLTLASVWYEQEIVQATETYLKGLNRLGVRPPIVAMFAIMNAKGASLTGQSRYFRRYQHSIDRDLLLLPDVVFQEFEADVARTLRPAFDAVWNACGVPQSANYDDSGNWAPRR